MDNIKETSTLGLAALFLAKGAKLAGTDKTNPKQMIFQFARQKTVEFKSEILNSAAKETRVVDLPLDAWEVDWINETVEVNAVKFFDALRDLKTVIHTR